MTENTSPPVITPLRKTLTLFKTVLPILVGMLLLINLLNPLLESRYSQWFTGHYLHDTLIGAVAGSISFGIPITSYIVGGELLAKGVSLLAVTAFILAWTTVGVAMLPLEAAFLGKKFALIRNILNFFFAILLAALTIFTLGLFK
ncbi:MAG: permease [Desulfobulbaceae bacterium]|nr:permease [Desulfobulbaceae bacterium]